MTDQSKKQKKFIAADNPIEQMKDLGSGVVSDVAEVPKAILDTAWEQIGLKPQRRPLSGEIDLAAGIHRTNKEIEKKEAGLEKKLQQLQYVQRQEKEIFSAKQKAVEAQIKKLLSELAAEVKRLETQTAELSADVRKITVESLPERPGIYHLNFFDWVIGTLRDLRKRVNESRLWLAAWTEKKRAKNYWAMFKKHGTSFAMSEERAIASANG